MLNNNITISKKCHYKHLTPSNRGQIQAYKIEGKSIRFIAKMRPLFQGNSKETL